jgi:hypothetical protein
MRLPIQNEPVQRITMSKPSTDGERGVAPSEYGVRPNGLADLLKGIINPYGIDENPFGIVGI